MSVLREHALAALAVVLAAPTLPAQTGVRTLSPARMQSDLFHLTEVLESQHGGLRRYAAQETLDESFGAAFHAVERELSVLEFYRVLSEVVAGVHCGHTRLRMGAGDQNAVLSAKGLLPLQLHLVGERAWILHNLDPALPLEPGTEVLAVDGVSMAEIRRIALSRMSGDGFIESGRERNLERGFAQQFALLVDDLARFPDGYELQLAGSTQPLEVPGLSPAEHSAARIRSRERPLLSLDIDERDDYGLLFVRGFGDSSQGTLPELLEASFRELRERRVGNLILDLRGNGGGEDMYGALLVSYLAREPFGYFERIEVTPDYEGMGEVVERDGRRLMLSHPGLELQQPHALRFQGPAWVLTDGWTFSTAADVATVAHHNGLAAFVGEETGGGYDGNTSGVSERIALPASGFTVSVPRWMYTTANVGHAHPGRGVPPDHPVRASIEDVLAGRDAELEATVELLRARR